MADSDAVRSARKRAHAAGDHSQCRPGCRRAPVAALPKIAAVPAVPAGNFDPSASLRALAQRLEAAHEADPSNAAVAKELRVTLQVLAGGSGGPAVADAVDLIRASWESGG